MKEAPPGQPISAGHASSNTSGGRRLVWCRRVAAFVLGAASVLGTSATAQETKSFEAPSSEPGGEAVVAGYGGSYALVVGMSDYAQGTGWQDLESVPGEVGRVERALRARGFEVFTHHDPDAQGLKRAFEDFIGSYGYDEDHRLLFYVSGHGYTLDNGRNGYLVPTDAPNPLRDEPGFRRSALSMTRIMAWAREMSAKHALFLFDSCFSGTIFMTRSLESDDVPPHIDRLAAEPVRQFITAGSAGEEVPARSTFTPAFVDALEGKGDLNRDGYVTGMELGMHLQEKVPRYTEQTPQFGKIRDYELSRGDFVFQVNDLVVRDTLTVITEPQDARIPDPAPAVSSPTAKEESLELKREEKRLIQMGLVAAGYDPGSADGMVGSGTRGAIRRWQNSRDRRGTGYLDADEAKELIKLGRPLNKGDLDMIDKIHLIANYIFQQNCGDYSSSSNGFDCENTEIKNSSLYLNGCYEHGNCDRGYRAITHNLSQLDQRKFTVSVDFNTLYDQEISNSTIPILVGGGSYRWFRIYIWDSSVSVAFNNVGNYVFRLFDGTEINNQKWYRIVCSVDILENKLRSILIDMDGNLIHAESIDLPDIELEIIEDKGLENDDRSFTFTNYSSGGVFYGYIRNLRIYSKPLSLHEMQLLHIKLRDSK